METRNHSTLKQGTVWIMAIACGGTVANIYYNQPLLAQMGQNFHVSSGQIGLIPTLTQIGVALGMFLFVPLGDMLERRRLIVIMLGVTACALVGAAISPSFGLLAVASLTIGVTSIEPHLIVPFAANLAGQKQRGQVVGSVMSGLLIGILLARTVSGFVGATLGWRAMYWIASGLMVGLAIVLGKFLPLSHPLSTMSYWQLLRSLPGLIREQPVLRESALFGAMLFGAFSAFWTTLVFLLAVPPYHYGSEVAGLFGLVGVIGASAAPLTGRLADRKSPRLTVFLGIAITMSSFVVFWLFGEQLLGLIVGVILLDLGVQSGHVSNQARIYNLSPEVHSRLNTVYMVSYFLGGALGSSLGAYGWSVWQWNGVCLVGLSMLTVAFAAYFRGRKGQWGGS